MSAVVPGAIVVGADGSPGSVAAVEWAAAQARLAARPLVLVHAVLPMMNDQGWVRGAYLPRELAQGLIDEAEKSLGEVEAGVRERYPDLEISTVLRRGDARVLLAELAAKADRIVVGSRGRGPFASVLLGSVGAALSRMAECPLVVVRPRAGDQSTAGVMVGLSTLAHSEAALAAGFAEAELRNAPLTIALCRSDGFFPIGEWVMAEPGTLEYDEPRLGVTDAVADLTGAYPRVPLSVVIARGSVVNCLVDSAAHHDLVVVGRGGARSFGPINSLATNVVEHAHSTVMVVP